MLMTMINSLILGIFLLACEKPKQSVLNKMIDPQQAWNDLGADDPFRRAVFPVLVGEAPNWVHGNAFYFGHNEVVTNYHVVSDCEYLNCKVLFVLAGELYEASLVRKRASHDTAKLSAAINERSIPLIGQRRDPVVGEEIKVVQNIYDPFTDSTRLVSQSGKIHSLGFIDGIEQFTHNANTLESSSGSPVLNSENEIIGLHSGFIDEPFNRAFNFRNVEKILRQKLQDELKLYLNYLNQPELEPAVMIDDMVDFVRECLHKDEDKLLKEWMTAVKASAHFQRLDFYFNVVRGIDLNQF